MHIVIQLHRHKPTLVAASQTHRLFLNWLLCWVNRQTGGARTNAHMCTETGIQTQTHTLVSSAELALACIPALRQRLLCLSAPASCDLCVCTRVCVRTSVCVSTKPLICVGERETKKNVNSLLIRFMPLVNLNMHSTTLSEFPQSAIFSLHFPIWIISVTKNSQVLVLSRNIFTL